MSPMQSQVQIHHSQHQIGPGLRKLPDPTESTATISGIRQLRGNEDQQRWRGVVEMLYVGFYYRQWNPDILSDIYRGFTVWLSAAALIKVFLYLIFVAAIKQKVSIF